MSTLMRLVGSSLFAFVLAGTGLAQENRTPIDNPQELVPATPLVTAKATAKRIRFVGPGTVVQLRLQVYNEAAQKLFDTELHGNVLDWHLQDGAGQDLEAGSYACVLTIKSLSGRLSQRVGLVRVNDKKAAIEATEGARLSPAQQQTIGPVEGNAALTILQDSEAEAITTVTHDGTDGQLTSTKGALTFRTGDIFSGKDKEHMRLAEDGRLGIGTSEPRATLDVTGTIRAERYLVAKPKKIDSASDLSPSLVTEAVDSEEALISGTGTQDRIAKWADNAGTLGDSVIAESAGKIGIGTTTPTQALEVANGRILTTGGQIITAAGGVLEIGTTVTNNNNGASGFRMRNTFNGNATFQQGLDIAPTFAPSANVSIARGFISTAFFAPPVGVTITDAFGGNANTAYNNTSGAVTNGAAFAIRSPIVLGALRPTFQYGMRINNQGIAGTNTSYGLFVDAQSGSTNNFSAVFAGGNVGIGTTAPAARLHVAGASSLADTPVGILESSGSQTPLSFKIDGTEFARIRVNNLGNLVIATMAGTQKNIIFRAGDDTLTDMFIQGSSGNVGIGTSTPDAKLEVSDGTILSSGSTGGRLGANNPNNQSASVNLDWFNDTARIRYGGSGAGAANGLVIQGQGDNTKLTITDSGNLIVAGKLFFHDDTFNPADATPPQDLCAREIGNVAPVPFQITLCSSSIRYKTDVHSFMPGLNLINRLRPVGFRWKGRGEADLGLIAEEVARVEPLLVTHNSKGEIEGVKYDRIGVVLLNAVREQQAQINTQQQQLREKDERIAKLAARLASYESNLARYDARLASVERIVVWGKRTKRQVTARVNSVRKRGHRRAVPPKAD